MRASSHGLAQALATRLGPVLPEPLSLRAYGSSVDLQVGSLSLDSCSDAAAIIEDEDGRTLGQRAQTALWAMMDGVQDAVMRSTGEQWPLERDGSLADPQTRPDRDCVHLWFGRSEDDPVIRIEPIAYHEFCSA